MVKQDTHPKRMFYTTNEAAHLLGVSRQTIWLRLNAGLLDEIPHPGRRHLLTVESVERMAAGRGDAA